jgi:hypothetical protein
LSSERNGSRDGLIVTGGVLVNGGLGYLVQVVAGLLLTATEYRDFGVVWAAVFFVAGALTGLQQEVTRDVRRGETGTSLTRVAAVVAIGLGAPLAVAALLLPDAAPSIWAMVAAAGSIAVHGVVTGTAYGAGAPRWAAAALVLEGVLRAALLLTIIVAAGGSTLPLGLGVALPFLAAALLVLPGLARRTGPVRLAASPHRVASNIGQTLLASAASATLVSGYPMFLSLLASSTAVELGAFVFAFTLTRAPLVVVMLGLQSFLIAAFRDREPSRAMVLAALGGLLTAIAVLAALAAAVGPWLLERYFDPGFALDAGTLFWIVLSAAPLCVLCITGPLSLARSQHRTFAAGWITAALVAVAVLPLGTLLALPFFTVATAAIMLGPLLGTLVHAAGLRRRR